MAAPFGTTTFEPMKTYCKYTKCVATCKYFDPKNSKKNKKQNRWLIWQQNK